MTFIGLIILLIVVGVILWLINAYIPMEAGMKRLLNIAVVAVMALVVIFFLLSMAGVVTGVPRLGID